MEDNKIIVFAGPTGVGKSTIIRYLKQNFNVISPICYTTRKKRNNNDDEYVFIDDKTFSLYDKNNLFFFTTGHNDNKYGYLNEQHLNGKTMLMATSYKNALRLAEKYKNTIIITLAYKNIESKLIDRMKLRNDNLNNFKSRINYAIQDHKNNFEKISSISALILYTDLYTIDEVNNIVSNYLSINEIIKKNENKGFTKVK